MENQDVLLFFRVSSGQPPRPVTLSSYVRNLQPPREALGTVLGHTALQEGRPSRGEGWIQRLEGQSVPSTASEGSSCAASFGPRSDHTVGRRI